MFIKGKNCPMKFKKEEIEGVDWGRLQAFCSIVYFLVLLYNIKTKHSIQN